MYHVRILICLLMATCAGATTLSDWNFGAYSEAMKQSGRKSNISEKRFLELQQRKETALSEIRKYLKQHCGKVDSTVVDAFRRLPREYFQYDYQSKTCLAGSAYEVPAKPWGIGYGSALSDYLGQAYMTQIIEPDSDDVVLEIGTGSGFQIALLGLMVKEAYSAEIVQPLGTAVDSIFTPLGLNNVHAKVGDGYYGWPEVAGGFDKIIVTCTASYVPPPLLEQLKVGGKMIIPIGQPYKRGHVFYIYTKDAQGKIHSKKDMGCYFVPMKGQIESK